MEKTILKKKKPTLQSNSMYYSIINGYSTLAKFKSFQEYHQQETWSNFFKITIPAKLTMKPPSLATINRSNNETIK